jgi:phosphate starvation-inducible PhoH-like protein
LTNDTSPTSSSPSEAATCPTQPDGQPCSLTLEPDDARHLAALCGQLDAHLRQIEERLGVSIAARGNRFLITWKTPRRHRPRCGRPPRASVCGGVPGRDPEPRERCTCSCSRPVSSDINFGIGPAGTGKTYLAVACAVEALEAERVARILLVRPAVEAGEKLGFLPGDLAQKIDPYLRPLYDALYEMLGFERVHKLIERNVIEVAPLAYMRGRTLNNAFIILDESQNTTVEQMKMFLTRIGFGSTAVITGDVTQVDLPRGAKSGLAHVMDVLDGVAGIAFTHFGSKDVVRHPMVQRIVEAYDRFERSQVPLPLEGGGAELRTVPAARVDAGDPAP